MTRRTAQMVRSPVARRAPTARSWALTPRCGRRTVERRRPGWLRSQVADPRGSVSANDGSYVTIDRGQRPPGSASRFGQSRVEGTGDVRAGLQPGAVGDGGVGAGAGGGPGAGQFARRGPLVDRGGGRRGPLGVAGQSVSPRPSRTAGGEATAEAIYAHDQATVGSSQGIAEKGLID